MLVSDIIQQAFLNMGAIAVGETMSTAEQTDAFTRLNQMISSWSTEQLTVPNYSHTLFAPTAGTASYTLGTGGSFVTTARPLRVTGAASVSGNFRQSMEVMSFEKFAATVADPLASRSVLALKLAADNGFPSINLRIFPVPDTAPGSLWLDYWMAIAQFATVGDTINLPDGWTDALHFNLAVALYPQYARAGGLDPIVGAKATQTKGSLVALNAQILGQVQQAPPAAQGGGQ